MFRNSILAIIFILFSEKAAGQITFQESAASHGITGAYFNTGSCTNDFDGDGDIDIISVRTNTGGISGAVYYRNDGSGYFTKDTTVFKLPTNGILYTVISGDNDNDGDLDVVIAGENQFHFFVNNGLGTFDSVTTSVGLAGARNYNVFAATFTDINNDGHIDIFLGTILSSHQAYHNNGNGTFTNATISTNLDESGTANNTRGLISGDFDNDGDVDIYITNMGGAPNQFFRNNNGVFTDIADSLGISIASENGISASAADYDNDGDLDILTGSLSTIYLFRNNGGSFIRSDSAAGLIGPNTFGSISFSDFDNDGDQDILGVGLSALERQSIYRNNGNGTFTRVTTGSGLITTSNIYSVNSADFNSDGKLDIFASTGGAGTVEELYLNTYISSNNWIQIRLTGSVSNESSIGAMLTAYTGSTRQTRFIGGGNCYMGQSDLTTHFGLGSATLVDSIVVKWPSGNRSTFKSVPVNQKFQIDEDFSPEIPSNVTTLASSETQIDLTWSSGIETGLFNIYRSQTSGSGYTLIGSTTDLDTNYSDTTAIPNTTYYYIIQSNQFGIESAFSTQDTASTQAIDIPDSVDAVALSIRKIQITWETDLTHGLVRILRADTGGVFSQIDSVSYLTTSYLDTTRNPNSTYTYKLISTYKGFVSLPSANKQVSTPPVLSPSNLSATALSIIKTYLTWTPGEENAWQLLFRSDNNAGFHLIDSLSPETINFTDSSLIPNTAYVYKLISVISGFYSEFSGERAISTPNILTPTQLSADALSPFSIGLNWTPGEEGAVQRIYRSSDGTNFNQIDSLTYPDSTYIDSTVFPDQNYTYKLTASIYGYNSIASNTYQISTLAVTAPSGVSLVPTSIFSVSINWQPGETDAHYYIYRSANGVDFFFLDSTSHFDDTTYVDTTLYPNSNYFYRIVSVINGFVSIPSNHSQTSTPPVLSPGNLETQPASFYKANLTWFRGEKNSIYRIYRSSEIGQAYIQIDSVPDPNSTFTDSTLTPGANYRYRIVSTIKGFSSVPSDSSEVTTPAVLAPSGLSASGTSITTTELDWTRGENQSDYHIFRSLDAVNYNFLDSVVDPVTNYVDLSALPGVLYYYKMHSKIRGYSSGYSNVASVTTPEVIIPSDLSAVDTSLTTVQIDWSRGDSGSTYLIYKKESQEADHSLIDSVFDPVHVYEDTTLMPGVTYDYKIASRFKGFLSSFSNDIIITTPEVLPPGGVTANAFSITEIDLQWNPGEVKAQYRIFRSQHPTDNFIQIDSAAFGVLSFRDGDLIANTTYFYKLASVYKSFLSSFSNTTSSTTMSVAVSISQVVVNQTGNIPENTPIEISCQISGTSPTVTLFYGKTSSREGQSLPMNLDLGLFKATIPANQVTQEGVWFRIKAENPANSVFYPETGRSDLPVWIPGFSSNHAGSYYPDGIPKNNYYLVSLPLDKTITLQSIFGEQSFNKKDEPENWAAYRYSATGQFELVDSLTDDAAFVVYHKTAVNDPIEIGSGRTVSVDQFDNMTLYPGWNIIPWPHTFSAAIRFIDSNHLSIGSVWERTPGGWAPATTYKSFAGYAVKNKTSSPVRVGDVLSWSTAPSKTSVSPNLFSMNFSANAGTTSDDHNKIVVSSVSGSYTEAEPFPLGNDLSVSFERDQMRLSTDLLAEGLPSYDWKAVVEQKTENFRTIRITWNVEYIPPSWLVYVFDAGNNRWVDLAMDRYEYTWMSKNTFVIFAGIGPDVLARVNEFKQSIPQTFALHQNFPNPFNPQTTIPYDLARSGQIELAVYNILGQKVKTLEHGFRATGKYTTIWDGTNEIGVPVSSGVYIYRLKTPNKTISKRLLLIK